MNTNFRSKVFGIVIMLALLSASLPKEVVYSQMRTGYDCGQWHFYDAPGRLGGWWFSLLPSVDQQPSWVMRNLPLRWGTEMDGAYTKIWNVSMDDSFELGPQILGIGEYETVSNCDPNLNLWTDDITISAGQCTLLHWNVDIAGVDTVYLDNQNVSPVGETRVCPTSAQVFALQVTTSQILYFPNQDSETYFQHPWVSSTTQNQYSTSVTVNVVSPTNTPLPIKTRIPPTATRMPATATKIPPTLIPVIPLATTILYQDGPLSNDGYNPGPSAPSWLDGIFQFFAPPVEASYSADDCRKRFAGPNDEYGSQCTTFVSGKRPDACEWITPGSGNAYQWIEQAQVNGESLGLGISSKAHPGDIVVWLPSKNQDCGGASAIPENGPCTIGASGGWEGCGHVAFVTWASTDGKKMKIEEANWGIDRSKDVVDVLSCMKFISSPSINPKVQNSVVTPVPTPVPGIVPTPSGKSSNLFQWIFNLFKP